MSPARNRFASLLLGALALTPAAFSGCSCDSGEDDGPIGGGNGGTAIVGPGSGAGNAGGSTNNFTNAGGNGACRNLECQQVVCSGNAKTTLSGRVFAPEGTIPLYNVVVYVPNAPLDPIPEGASCDQCAAQGDPVVSAITDANGAFVLENVPVGDDIPLVIQVGKWRRELVVPSVAECVDTPLDETTTRLPRNKAEGNIPKIALTTGGADPLECLLPKIGLDIAEFTNPDGDGRIHLFHGEGGGDRYAGGADFPDAQTLWATTESLSVYDIVLLACEGGTNEGTKPDTARQAMLDYTSLGGRVFASHWHNVWVEEGPDPFPSVATFNHQADLANPFTALIDTSFPKGVAFSEWLVNVGASTVPSELVIAEAQHTIDAVNTAVATRWVYGQNPTSVQYLTFNTPVGVEEKDQCGRLVLSDIHVSSGDQIGEDFPDGCNTTTLSPQEKALLFMLFDLSACIIPDDDPPTPPQ